MVTGKIREQDTVEPEMLFRGPKKIRSGCFAFLFLVPLVIFIYIKTHPLVFNESWFEHSHCIAQAYNALRIYSDQNNGSFPYSDKGYAEEKS